MGRSAALLGWGGADGLRKVGVARRVTITGKDTTAHLTAQATLTQTVGPVAKVVVGLSPSSIVATGTSHSRATATVEDAVGHPVPGGSVAFSASDSAETIGPVTDKGNGVFTATITSSKTVHQVTVTATDTSVSPHVSGRGTLTQTIGPATTVTVGLSPGSIAANGTAKTVATATVRDAGGHLIAGDHVTFTSNDSGEKIGAVTDHGNGNYSATIISSKTVHQVTITAQDSSVSPTISGHATLTQTSSSRRT